MKVYHGSDTNVENPRILPKNRPLDFGDGFYVTTNYEQAKNWAKRVAIRNDVKQRYINAYEFDFAGAKEKLRILMFDKADAHWLDFVCWNRQGKESREEYDIIGGPVADDKVYRVIVSYENGLLDKEEALKRLKTEELCDQIVFHTPASLRYLEYQGAEVQENE